MSDPVTNVEIEDVLSSIRRLVSEDTRTRPAFKPARQRDRLVLTPALRVKDAEADEAAIAPDRDNGLAPEPAAPPVLLTEPNFDEIVFASRNMVRTSVEEYDLDEADSDETEGDEMRPEEARHVQDLRIQDAPDDAGLNALGDDRIGLGQDADGTVALPAGDEDQEDADWPSETDSLPVHEPAEARTQDIDPQDFAARPAGNDRRIGPVAAGRTGDNPRLRCGRRA